MEKLPVETRNFISIVDVQQKTSHSNELLLYDIRVLKDRLNMLTEMIHDTRNLSERIELRAVDDNHNQLEENADMEDLPIIYRDLHDEFNLQ